MSSSSVSPEAGAMAGDSAPSSIVLLAYPKIVFLYPTFIMALLAACYTTWGSDVLAPTNTTASIINILFLDVFALNLVILAFDFPRTTSLTLFFCIAAIIFGVLLLFRWNDQILPWVTNLLSSYHPAANATFYWSFVAILGVIYAIVYATTHFDYWEVRPNELLHHHGFLSNLERFAAPNLRIDKEINDVFEYLLLGSGRLIMHPSSEPRAVILDNVPFISVKEKQITRMLGALQVEVRQNTREGQ